ncbi:MAG: large conductance mechanosensitive channel protein MscL [Sphingobium sp.]
MLSEFKAFIARGNVLDLAVGVIIGGAFGTIVSSLTDDVIMPVVGAVTGGVDFSSHFLQLGTIPADFKGDPGSYADLKKAGVAMIGFGAFITAIIKFIILAFIIFLIVRQANKLFPKPEAGPAAEPADVTLLREIRDTLQKKD